MKPRILYPIIVEGKYDKIKLDSIVDANIITTGGFSIFTGDEKISLIKRLADKTKIIILTDSDGAGHLIRSHIKTALSPEQIINLYTPQIEGKEKRKSAPSKAGTLGVEGIEAKMLLEILSPYFENAPKKEYGGVTKADFYSYGLSGRENSQEKRKALLRELNLPVDMSPNATLQAVNMLFTKEEFIKLMEK
jgi:ribonuclease M5